MKIKRLKRLAGLNEAEIIDPDDYDDQMDDERQAREAKITQAILLAFKRIGLTVAERRDLSGYDVIYFDDDREATVTLDDSEVDIGILTRLYQTGLSDNFTIQAGSNHELRIEFIVSGELDNAILK